MAENWASNFDNNAGTADGNDDWADFGGFESAAPSSNPFSDATAVQGFPWATAFPVNPQQAHIFQPATPQPTIPQPTVPQSTIPQPTIPQPTIPQPTIPQPTIPQPTIPQPTIPQPTIPQPTIPQPTVPQPTIPQPTTPQPTIPQPPSPRPTSQPNNDTLISPSIQSFTQSTNDDLSKRPVSNELPTQDYMNITTTETKAMVEMREGLVQSDERISEFQRQLTESEQNLSLAESEVLRLKQEISEYEKRHEESVNLGKQQHLKIEEQKEKYMLLQEKHEDQLKELRDAGHEALALIVEEYKELAKNAVLQQQETNERCLRETLKSEREKFDDFMKQHNENTTLLIKEEQSKNITQLEKALTEQKRIYEEKLEECVKEEGLRSEEAIQHAVDEEKKRSEMFLKETLENQEKKFETFIEDQKKLFEDSLEIQRKQTNSLVQTALRDEQEQTKLRLDEVVVGERQKSREALQNVKEQVKDDMQNYITEKEKADNASRQGVYQSMSLFLSGVQSQLESLMNTEQSS